MTVTDNPRLDAPREDLVRMTETVRAADDGNTLVGDAAVFNRWTEIDSWEGRFKERIAPGAFKKTLAERGDRVKVLFNHGMDPSIGNKPLGKPTVLEENGRALHVEVPLDDTSYNQDIKALLRSGALDGMSFRMTVVQDEWDKLDGRKGTLPERTIKEVRLHEVSVVTFPAYEATKAGVRAHAPSAFDAWRSANPSQIIVPNEDRNQQHPTEQDPPADPEVTDEDADSGPGPDPTRNDDAMPVVATYTPAQRPPMSPERRQAQMGLVRALLAQTSKE